LPNDPRIKHVGDHNLIIIVLLYINIIQKDNNREMRAEEVRRTISRRRKGKEKVHNNGI